MKVGVIAFGLGVFILLLLAVYMFQKRDDFLAKALVDAKTKLRKEYNLNLIIDNAAFSGFKTVKFDGIQLVPIMNDDTLLNVQTLEVSVKLFPLLAKKVKIHSIDLNNASLSFVKEEGVSNYDFLFKKEAREVDSLAVKERPHLGRLVDRMVNSILYKIPDNMDLLNMQVSYRDDSVSNKLRMEKANIVRGKLQSTIHLNEGEAIWHLEGDLHPGRKKIDLKLFAEGKPVEFPFLENKYKLKLSFDTLETSLESVRWKNREELLIDGSWKISNLLINHWRLASNDIYLPRGILNAEFSIGKNSASLEPNSEMRIGKLLLSPSFTVSLGAFKTYALSLRMEDMNAQDAFDSFPRGLFTSLEGIKVSGKMNYRLDFFLDSQLPDSVRLESRLDAPEFRVNTWGKTDLSKINTPFVYIPHEDGKAQRSIIIGPTNPDFIRINQVSPFLKHAILTAEDNLFFEHEGFSLDAIKASIATNFKEKAFKRGGSTISMQLVKNVYLDREKTLARKIEEMLIVWMIEHNRIVSKERMFEVYLNIIEWGRNVYGVGEASRYYFSKHPSELNLGESIYLASIIPRPKISLSRFDYTGHLKPYMAGYYRLIGSLMARKGYATRDSTQSYGFYSVQVREALRPSAPPVDTLEIQDETNFLEEEIENVKRMLQNFTIEGVKEKEDE